MSKDRWRSQVSLLLRVLPIVFQEKCFALKGGTAINLFVRNLPRLSVDIDLAYLSNEPRKDAIPHIHEALSRIGAQLQKVIPGILVHKSYTSKADSLKLILTYGGVTIKVELSPVLRGTVFDAELREVAPQVDVEFGYAQVPVVSIADLYGGKICAALDRQHPRDLFDIHLLLKNEGITDRIRKAFLVYLICHPRPFMDLLRPRVKNMEKVFASEFVGMTQDPITLEELNSAFRSLVHILQNTLTLDEKNLLISVMSASPMWHLLGVDGYNKLPAVQWKLLNISQMNELKRKQEVQELTYFLGSKEPWL